MDDCFSPRFFALSSFILFLRSDRRSFTVIHSGSELASGSGSQQPKASEVKDHICWQLSTIMDHYKTIIKPLKADIINFSYKPIHDPTTGKVLSSRTSARLCGKSLLLGGSLLRIDHRAIHQGLNKIKSCPEVRPEH